VITRAQVQRKFRGELDVILEEECGAPVVWIDAGVAEGLGDASRGSDVVVHEFAERAAAVAATAAVVQLAERVLRDILLLDLSSKVSTGTDALAADVHAHSILQLIQILTATLRKVLVGSEIRQTVTRKHERRLFDQRVGQRRCGEIEQEVEARLRDAKLVQEARTKHVGLGDLRELRVATLLRVETGQRGIVTEVGKQMTAIVDVAHRDRVHGAGCVINADAELRVCVRLRGRWPLEQTRGDRASAARATRRNDVQRLVYLLARNRGKSSGIQGRIIERRQVGVVGEIAGKQRRLLRLHTTSVRLDGLELVDAIRIRKIRQNLQHIAVKPLPLASTVNKELVFEDWPTTGEPKGVAIETRLCRREGCALRVPLIGRQRIQS